MPERQKRTCSEARPFCSSYFAALTWERLASRVACELSLAKLSRGDMPMERQTNQLADDVCWKIRIQASFTSLAAQQYSAFYAESKREVQQEHFGRDSEPSLVRRT